MCIIVNKMAGLNKMAGDNITRSPGLFQGCTEQRSPAPAYSGLADDDPLMLAAGAFTQMLSMWGQQPYTSHFQPPPWLQRLKPV